MMPRVERRTRPRYTDRLKAARERLEVVLADARRLRAGVEELIGLRFIGSGGNHREQLRCLLHMSE
jgi:hypothetical protein